MQEKIEYLLELVAGELEFSETGVEEALSLLEVVILRPKSSILYEKNADLCYELEVSVGRCWLMLKTVYQHTFVAIVRETSMGNRAIVQLDELVNTK